ncbi:type III restriction-modification system StyLTI enzyme res [Mycobacteroides abscessus subsp. abscessus]|jgi:type III restriction enzyme|uniref:type III restriction-modification system endonuclease n=1 Tax=Mycobacteriaceae TaxID=1762 RepID=UPI0009A8B410|nr:MULTISPECIES: DEAD/DEAH box helicase family protein [Mycobacteriaceae]MBP8180062.1 DEAD/DEAH box helicase family protein [Acidimicrobiia bacterium]MDP7701089.1 DEAD/DEAH box helicase family protein [Mycobacterium sp. TY815]MDP7707524.1 DEAD/DEAH box helicase family protein [Mycobacterium sp. TY815]MDP7707612.1 DEAD/DEAH box helicase family protein [Mycobacterium sp. TY815]SKG21195.1 type III restriction-modification system StyLTI enzyme res [Mycobacteroides abscessus subsp. abscessus]
MKLQFKIQQYQTDAVDAIVEAFAGQPKHDGVSYRIDPGSAKPATAPMLFDPSATSDSGLRNAEIALTPAQWLENVQRVQRSRNLPLSDKLVDSKAAPGAPNLDVEMETGTGKTYVYIKTMMELHKRYGWSKFIIVVPSVAIREGVKKSIDLTAEHFQQMYGTKPRSFIYNSSQLHELERFSSDAGVQVMIINIQAFNSTSKDNRRIYDELDDFQSRRPIDVISANRPIVIIDEPQKISAPKSLEALSRFNALMVLRYSATHKIEHTKVHRLDALDAYNQKLVKKIAVRGITVKGLAGTTAYLYLDAIEIAKGAKPRARVEIEVQTKGGPISRQVKRLDVGAHLHDISNGIEAYKDLFITDIDANRDFIELSNGDVVIAGQLSDRDVTEEAKRRIQIREVIRAHLDKERELFAQGVKVLSLFFIDEVAKYRDYDREDTLGDYARIFEEEYAAIVDEILGELELDIAAAAYRAYLRRDDVHAVHEGYFSIDKKTRHAVDGPVHTTGDEKGQSKDVDAYDLILKDKERLLSLAEPVRFIFSHSALREGWDNPNVFVMGMLKKSDNTVSRRQEIGRGLRLAVDQHGERMDNPVTVHDINELTVVTDESYTDFVAGLQKEISDSLAARPRKASVKFFTGKTIQTEDGESLVEEALAQALYKYLIKNDYLNDDDTLSDEYKAATEAGTLAEPASEILKPMLKFLLPLVDSLNIDVPAPTDDRKPKKIPLNEANFAKKEFQALWRRINHKAVYQVEFDSSELVTKCIHALDKHLKVAAMQYVVQAGTQRDALEADDLTSGAGFDVSSTTTHTATVSAASQVKYDLLGEITEKTQLTRRTAAAILSGVTPETFAKFRLNPEQFITEAVRLINEQKATAIVEHLTYDALEDRFDTAIFTENQTKQDLTHAGNKLTKHIYDYVVTDSKVERDFVTELDTSQEVAVYAKLPRGFFIPTPVGDYNPDWAIAFTEGTVKHIYFVAETKGSLSSLQLKGVEDAKIECARKFFASLNEKNGENVKYEVVTDYTELMQLVTA